MIEIIRRTAAAGLVALSLSPVAMTAFASPAAADPSIGRLAGVAIVDGVTYLVYEVPGGYRFVPA